MKPQKRKSSCSRRYLHGAAVLALSVSLLAGCGSDDDDAPAAGDLPIVRIQVISDGMSAVGMKAMELSKSDTKNGFQAEYHYVSGDTANQFFLQRESDIALGLDPISVAIFRNEDHDVSTYYQYQPNYACLVSKAKYDDPAQLKGKKVGHTGLDSGTTQSVAVTLERFWNIDLFEDFEPVEGNPQVLSELLQKGDIEAATLYAAFATRAIVEGGAKCLTGFVGDVWEEQGEGPVSYTSLVAYNDWLDENEDTAVAVTKALKDGVSWLKEHPEKLGEEPILSLIGTDNPDVMKRLEQLINDGVLYDPTWGDDVIAANKSMLEALADDGVFFKDVPDGIFRTLEGAES